jgi:hypothetical protein
LQRRAEHPPGSRPSAPQRQRHCQDIPDVAPSPHIRSALLRPTRPASRPRTPHAGPTLHAPRTPARPAPRDPAKNLHTPSRAANRSPSAVVRFFYARYGVQDNRFYLPIISLSSWTPLMADCRYRRAISSPWRPSLSLSSLYKLEPDLSLQAIPSSLLLPLTLRRRTTVRRSSIAGVDATARGTRPRSTLSEPRPTSRTPARARSSTTARHHASSKFIHAVHRPFAPRRPNASPELRRPSSTRSHSKFVVNDPLESAHTVPLVDTVYEFCIKASYSLATEAATLCSTKNVRLRSNCFISFIHLF